MGCRHIVILNGHLDSRILYRNVVYHRPNNTDNRGIILNAINTTNNISSNVFIHILPYTLSTPQINSSEILSYHSLPIQFLYQQALDSWLKNIELSSF